MSPSGEGPNWTALWSLNDQWSCAVEDGEASAWLHLLKAGERIASVWLYNHGPAPKEYPWTNGSAPPMQNPKDFVLDVAIRRAQSPEDWQATWIVEPSKGGVEVRLFLRGELIAIVAPEWNPGFCRYASKKSPLALPFADYPNL